MRFKSFDRHPQKHNYYFEPRISKLKITSYSFIIVEESKESDFNVGEEDSMRESLDKAIEDINRKGESQARSYKKSNEVLFYFDLRIAKDM